MLTGASAASHETARYRTGDMGIMVDFAGGAKAALEDVETELAARGGAVCAKRELCGFDSHSVVLAFRTAVISNEPSPRSRFPGTSN